MIQTIIKIKIFKIHLLTFYSFVDRDKYSIILFFDKKQSSFFQI